MKKTPTDIHWLKIDAQPVKAGENLDRGERTPSPFPVSLHHDNRFIELDWFEFC